MIKENELRIGNKLYEATGEVGDVIVGNRRLELFTEMRGNISLAECAPIPLTPEWLERLGYKKDLSDGKYYKEGSVLPPLYFINNCRWGMSTLPVTGHHLHHVHQLQNLYFALTGEELTINNVNIQIPS